jgi:signal transduction histidine kinase/ligand-binding sensor protein
MKSDRKSKNNLLLEPAPDRHALAEIVDTNQLQSLFESFYQLTGFGNAVVDNLGKVLVANGWQDICARFHRIHPETRAHCIASDIELAAIDQPGKFVIYKCRNNMWDMATPIVAGGYKLGNIYLGQFFLEDEEIDNRVFCEQARRYGFNEPDYLAALDKVPRWSRQKVEDVMRFYARMANLVAELGYSRLTLQKTLIEKDKAFAALEQEQREKNLILNNLAEHVSYLDPDFHIIWANDEVSSKHKKNGEELSEKTCYEAIYGRHKPCEPCPVARALQTGKVCSDTTQTPDGHYWRMTGNPVHNDHGELIGVLDISLDITDLVKAEKELEKLNKVLEDKVKERTNELEKLNRELDAFTYSVSHDLRAPLRHIEGFSKALLEDHSAGLDKAGKKYLERIITAGNRMDELICDLLNLSRVTRREVILNKVDLSEIVSSYLRFLCDKEPREQANFIVAPGLEACCDTGLLRIALENLLDNAWKFTAHNHSTVIEFGQTEIRGHRAFFVKDNGAGFDQNYASKMFKPFQRLHSEHEYPGTGIGLSIVSRIIDRHDGEIWAEGAVYNGAVFYFTLGSVNPAE